jgi:hypothetical protein
MAINLFSLLKISISYYPADEEFQEISTKQNAYGRALSQEIEGNYITCSSHKVGLSLL